MITSQMSHEELANEVAKDYVDVCEIMRKKIPDALKLIRKQSQFPAYLFSTVTSPRKNKWILIFVGKSKRRLKRILDSFLVCIRETDHGKYVYRYDLPTKEGSLPGVTFYPPHFFSRYAQRMGLEITGEELIKRYLKINTAMRYNTDQLLLSEEEMRELKHPVWYTSPDGISLGSVTMVPGMEIFICTTFVPWNMCKRDQLIRCGRAEMERLKEDLELDSHVEDVVSQYENNKVVEEFARMILNLVEKVSK